MARDFARELARLDQRVKNIEKGQRYAHGGSIEDSALEVKDGTGSLRAIVGVQSDGTTAVNIVNGPPPPTPSAPILASVLGGVTVSWNGSFAEGTVPPLDWQRVEVHASTVDGFTPALETLRSTFETPQGGTVVVPCEEPVYVLLVARSTSGTPSDPTVQAGPLGPAPVVATDLVDGIVTTVKLADDAVTKAKVAAAAVTPEALAPVLADTVSQRWVDTMDDPDAWQVLTLGTGSSWAFTPLAGAPSGGQVGQASGYVTLYGTTRIPYDPSTLYRVTMRLRASVQPAAGPDNVYLGLMGFAGDKTTFVNRSGANSSGAQFYCVASLKAVSQADGWQVWTGFVKGRTAPGENAFGGEALDPLNPTSLHDQVRYVSPYLLLNYTLRDPAGVIQVDSVMVEALRTGVVTAAYLAAGSVSTSKLVAGAVQTAQLDAGAVNADKIAAGAVTTAKLDALAVTADKIAANAITAGKIFAGAVDATALAADAITGKTITGGTITGAQIQTATTGQRITINEADANKVLVYNADGTTIGELSDRGLLLAGTTGAIVWMDPSATQPQLRFDNSTSANTAYITMVETTGPNDANLHFISGTFNGDGYTDRVWRQYMGNDFARIERVRFGDGLNHRGGRLNLRADYAEIGYMSYATPSDAGYHLYQPAAVTTKGRHIVDPQDASSNSVLYVAAQSAHSGPLLRLYRDTDKFAVDKDGNTVISGMMTAGNIITGTTTITPSAAHTPTSAPVSFPALKGSTFRGYATAATTVPGVRTPVGAQGVTGVSVSSVTSTGMLVWVNRENTTATIVNWMVIGS